MIFTPEHIQAIVSGTKTQTRRLCLCGPKYLDIGKEFTHDVYLRYESDWSPANVSRVNFPGEGVYRQTGWTGGWLSGDYCLEPEWWDRPKWIVGRDYAVSPGRGKPGVLWRDNPDFGPEWWRGLYDSETLNAISLYGWGSLRIQITAIRLQRLQDISEEDARAEGVLWVNTAPLTTGAIDESCIGSYVVAYRNLWDTINTRKGTRWADNPLVWALTFRVKD